MTTVRDELASLLLALQFLTRIPVPSAIAFNVTRERGAVKYYPLIGALVGAIGAGVFWLCSLLLPGVLSILLSMAATALITGAFHEDGLADVFDGLGAGNKSDRMLAIMKDSRLGTYGVLALLFTLGLKLTALVSLSTAPEILIAVLVAAHCLSRASSVLVIATSDYVREEGTGKPTADGIAAPGLLVVAVISILVLVAASSVMPLTALGCALAGLCLGHLFSRWLYETRLGGYTGDCLGATQQISELAFYLGLAACL